METATDEALARVELHFGAWLEPGRHLALVVGGAARRWDRDIRPTTVVSRAGVTSAVGGLHEIYGWGELFTGLRAGADLGGRLRVELEARVVQGVLPRITVELGAERVTLRLGERLGWGASLGGRLALPRRWELGVAVEAEGYRFGRSPVDPVTGLMEPDSETLGVSLGARLGRSF